MRQMHREDDVKMEKREMGASQGMPTAIKGWKSQGMDSSPKPPENMWSF